MYYYSLLDKVYLLNMSSPPKLLVFQKSSEKDEKQDDGEKVDKHDGEAKMSKEEDEVVCIATTASIVNNDEGDDDGYHTPTSPRHKIPTAMECPPAPRKRLCRKRVREQVLQRYRQVVGVVVCEIGDDDVISPKAKKARGGGRSTIANGN